MERNYSCRFFFLSELHKWQKIRNKAFKRINKFDKHEALRKSLGVEKLNKYSNEYELQTICNIFQALTPAEALEHDDAFLTKHLLAKLEKSEFDSKFEEERIKRLRKK